MPLPALNPGQGAWVSTLWRGASADATSSELTVVQPIPQGVSVSYPENTWQLLVAVLPRTIRRSQL